MLINEFITAAITDVLAISVDFFNATYIEPSNETVIVKIVDIIKIGI